MTPETVRDAMANPKATFKARTAKRRANWKLSQVNFSVCESCRSRSCLIELALTVATMPGVKCWPLRLTKANDVTQRESIRASPPRARLACLFHRGWSPREEQVRIAVDAMGGDYAPDEVVKGSARAAQQGIEVILVGDKDQLEPLWAEAGRPHRLTIHHAPEVIMMDDHPVEAVRKKRQSSLVQTIELVKKGEAEGAVSAGNTGAVMAAALLLLGRLPGVLRPAITSPMPTRKGNAIILDAGANVDCRPQHLAQFAIMGSFMPQRSWA